MADKFLQFVDAEYSCFEYKYVVYCEIEQLKIDDEVIFSEFEKKNRAKFVVCKKNHPSITHRRDEEENSNFLDKKVNDQRAFHVNVMRSHS